MKKRSLVLITVDCLRADHVGFLGYSPPVTPFLDSLAKSSFAFTDAIVAGAPTYFSFPAIMASRYPLALGRDILGIAPGEPTLATALRDAGYSTSAFLAGNPYLTARFGYQQGFEIFRDFLDPVPPEQLPSPRAPAKGVRNLNAGFEKIASRNSVTSKAYEELYFWYCQWSAGRDKRSLDQMRRYPAADVIVDHARSWLSGAGEQPFFMWIHLMDPHHPYYPPAEALSSFGISTMTARRALFLNSIWNRDVTTERLRRYRQQVVSLYDAGVHWADKQVARLVRALQQLRRWDDTVFAVTADHGEGFLEHGSRYHSPTDLPEHLIHVPLLLKTPENTAPRRVDNPFSLINLAPTLLAACEVKPPERFQGKSCWPQILSGTLPDEPVIAECVEACNNPLHQAERMRPSLLAVRDRTHKLVFHFGKGVERLYDLNSAVEGPPLPDDALPDVRGRLLQNARTHLARTRHGENEEIRLRARVREVMHSLEARKTASAPERLSTFIQ